MKTWRNLDTEQGEKMLVDSPDMSDAEEMSLAPLTPGGREPPARSQWQLFLRRFLRHRLAVASLVILVVLYIVVSFPHVDRPLPAQPEATLAPHRADGEALARHRRPRP